MSALTNLFTSMANKIRSKTGTVTTYTPAEMVSDGIDDVFDAGVESATTPITPSNSSPASMTSGTGYKPTTNGYAISSYSEITPSPWQSGTPISSGDIIRFTGDGYVVPEDEEIAPRDVEAPRLDGRTHYFVTSQDGGYAVENQPVVIHPSDSHAVFLERGLNYNIMYSDGYAIESNPESLTPSDSSPASISSGGMYRAGGAGYAIQSNPTSLTPSNSSPASISSGTIYKGNGAGYAIQSYDSVTPSSSPASVASGDIVKIGGSGVIVDALPTPTSITPDDGTPVQMTTGNSYSVSRTGYAIQNQPTTLTPNVFNPPSISNGTIYKGGGNGGYAIPSYTTVTPSDTPTSLITTQFYYVDEPLQPPDTAYVIKRYSSLTPSDSSPAAITNGLMYQANGAGYAIESEPATLTPVDYNSPSITSGNIYKATDNGVAVKNVYDITPTDTSAISLNRMKIYRNNAGTGTGVTAYAIKNYYSVTPNDSNPVAVSSGYFYKPSKNGYLYENQQSGTNTQIYFYAVNARGGNGFNKTETITITKKVTQFIIFVQNWNGYNQSYWTGGYKDTVTINNEIYNDWGPLINTIAVASTGNYNSGYGVWHAICNKTLNVGDVVKLDLSTKPATSNWGLAIALLN